MSTPYPAAPFTLRYPYLSFLFPPVIVPSIMPNNCISPTLTGRFNITSLLPVSEDMKSPIKSAVTMKCPHCMQTFDTAPLLELHLLSHRPLIQIPTTSQSIHYLLSPVALKSPKPPGISQNSSALSLSSASSTTCATLSSASVVGSSTSSNSSSSSKSPNTCQCQVCGKVFSRHWLLQGHIRTHTGEKPFKCHICTKAFADKSNLRAHVQTHSGIKPFACSRCGKRFALKSYLSKHEESTCMRSAITKPR